jgi:hypothetical protein
MNFYIKLEKPWYTKLFNSLSSPFSYESGFYFKGKKSYHMWRFSVCSLAGLIFLLCSTVVLFEPVLSGRVIYSDLESQPMNSPADLPKSLAAPSWISQFFGEQVPREHPILNLTKFVDQYKYIEVFGAEKCEDTDVYCVSSGLTATPIQTTCTNVKALPREKYDFGYTFKNLYTFRN